MPAPRHPRILALAAAAFAAACGPKEAAQAPGAPAAPAASAEAPLLRLVATDFAFTGPDTVAPGFTTVRLVNHGPSLHHVQLVRLEQGKTLADLGAATQHEGPLPAWAVLVGGPNAAAPNDSMSAQLTLEAGNYAVICVIPGSDMVPHVAKGMARPLTVAGTPGTSAEPATADTMRLADYGFTFSRPLTAGHHVIRVENAASQPHEVVLVRLAPGKTAKDFADWAMTMAGPPPAMPAGGATGIAPGGHNLILADLAPGEYALVCFFPDAKDGKPHVAHGMLHQVTVS